MDGPVRIAAVPKISHRTSTQTCPKIRSESEVPKIHFYYLTSPLTH